MPNLNVEGETVTDKLLSLIALHFIAQLQECEKEIRQYELKYGMNHHNLTNLISRLNGVGRIGSREEDMTASCSRSLTSAVTVNNIFPRVFLEHKNYTPEASLCLFSF